MSLRQIARSSPHSPDMCVQWLMVGLDYLIFLDEGSNIIVSALDKGTRPLRSLSEKPGTNDWLCQGGCVLGSFAS